MGESNTLPQLYTDVNQPEPESGEPGRGKFPTYRRRKGIARYKLPQIIKRREHSSSDSEDHVDLIRYVRRKSHGHKKDKSKVLSESNISFRNIRKFRDPPESLPMTLCFTCPGVEILHSDVISALCKVPLIDKSEIDTIQFIEMNVVVGTAGRDNRWLITVKNDNALRILHKRSLLIAETPVFLRLYDEVLNEDYEEFLRRRAMLNSEELRAAYRVLGKLPASI